MKRTFHFAFWIAMAVLVIGILAHVREAHAQDRKVAGSTVMLQEVLTSASGQKRMSGTYMFATRSDGSTAFIGTTQSSGVEAPTRIINIAAGQRGYVSDALRIKYIVANTSTSDPGDPRNLRIPSGGCVKAADQAVAVEQIAGYRAERVQGYGRTAWFSLDYGCALLQEHFDWPDGSKSDKHLTMLRPGDPDPALFTIPADYIDQPKSTFLDLRQ